MPGGVPEVDLVALLPGEAGLGDHHPAAPDLGLHETVVGDVPDAVADQVGHEIERLRPLDLHRADVDLVDLDVHLHPDVDPLQPEQDVGVREREPELVLGEPEQHGVVQDPAPLVAEDHVLRMHRLDAGRVAGDDVVGEPLGVRTLHPDLALDRDVPHGDVLRQRLVLRRRAPVLRPHVAPGVIDAVVDRRPPAARLVGQVPVGRLAHARGDEKLGRGPAALAKVDGDDPVGLVDAFRLAGHGTPRNVEDVDLTFFFDASGTARGAPRPRRTPVRGGRDNIRIGPGVNPPEKR